MTKLFDQKLARSKFASLSSKLCDPALVYFDNGATSQIANCVVDAMNYYYREEKANVHRGSHFLSAKATSRFEEAREAVARFINAGQSAEIIWTKGTTEAVNIVVQCLPSDSIRADDEIVISYAEHHANLVPWQQLAKRTGAKLIVLPLMKDGKIDIESNKISRRCKLLAIHHVSNVVGKFNHIEGLLQQAKNVGAITFVDGAQAIAHTSIDVQALDCDFYAFSGHKMYGPTGIGVLYGKRARLDEMYPYQFGGEMIKTVSIKDSEFNELPFKFEAGTPNIAGAIGLASATQLLYEWRENGLDDYESQLTQYLYHKLATLKNVIMPFTGCPDIPLVCFSIRGIHHHDIAASLSVKGIAIRSGHHCAMPLMTYLQVNGLIRVSLAPYNTKEEVDYFVECLQLVVNAPIEQKNTAPNLTKYQAYERIRKQFLECKSWDAKHRVVMLLGKEFPRLSTDKLTIDNKIQGCESSAWLAFERVGDESRLLFSADSNARVIRGLLHIILAIYNNKTAQEILAIDIDSCFEELGLMEHLSPSRGNGVQAIVAKIMAIAQSCH